jgi:DNA polymerase
MNGQRIACGPFFATIHPEHDFETYSEAGFLWIPPAPPERVWKSRKPTKKRPEGGEWITKVHFGYWDSPPGVSDQKRGLKSVGTRNYVTHPSFDVLAFAYDLKDGKGRRRWRPVEGIGSYASRDPRQPLDLLDYIRDGGILESWNIMFEWSVWTFHCVPRWGWPELKVEQLRCCMAKGKASAYPGELEETALVLRLQNQKDMKGSAVMKKLTKPKNPSKKFPERRWTRDVVPLDYEALESYNEQDIATEAEASTRIPDLTPHELDVWRFDFRCNVRGMQIDTKAREDCISIIEQAFAKYNAELFQLCGVEKASKAAELKRWLATQGCHLEDLDEEAVEEALKRPYSPKVLRVLKIRQILAFGSVRKLYAMRTHATATGRLHDQYVYYGAHTGLWNGRAVQPANLYKSERFFHPAQVDLALSIIATRNLATVEAAYGDALELVADCLRSMIVARPGCRLISADFTAIQAVVTSALAGEEWRLEVFRTHGKIYEAMASRLTGKPFQFYLDYKAANKKNHEDRQKWGKLPVLSGDFGAWIGGWKRFGADKVIGDDAAIKAAILKTRAAIPNIVEFWGGQTRNKFNKGADGQYAEEFADLYGLEGAAIRAVSNYIRTFGEGAKKGVGEAFAYRSVGYQVIDDILYCIPPSGGLIRYHAPRLDKSDREYASPWEVSLSYEGWNTTATKGKEGWQRMDLYGGVLTQNVVSHVAREVQAHALLRLERHGYEVVMHTHDENVVEMPIGRGSVEEYTRLMRVLPDFCRDEYGRPWPINVPDAWEAFRYGKWEF